MEQRRWCVLYLLMISACTMTPRTMRAQHAVAANPTRPSAADNGYLTARGHAEIESGWLRTDGGWSLPALLKFAVSDKVEVGFAMSGILNHTTAGGAGNTEAGDPGAQVKVQLAKGEWGAFAVAGRADFPADFDPHYTFYSVLTHQNPAFQLDVTAGGASFDTGRGRYDQAMLYAISLSPKVKGRLGGFAELFGEFDPGAQPVSADVGVAFAYTPRLIADLAVTAGLNNDAPDWVVQAGFTATLVRIIK